MNTTKKLRHAVRSASGAYKWAACAGSIEAEDGLPNTFNEAAYVGTCAHELASVCGKMGELTSAFIGEELTIEDHDPDSPYPAEFIVTEEMAYHVQQYLNRCYTYGGEAAFEIRGSYTNWVHEGFGTSDFVTFSEEALGAIIYDAEISDDGIWEVVETHGEDISVTVMTVRDLKYGIGVPVHAKGNLQGICYALAMYQKYNKIYDFDFIRIDIDQPRLDTVTSWVIDIATLLQYGDQLALASEATMQPNAPRTPGEKQCQFCKAKAAGTCKPLADYLDKKVMQGLVPLDEVVKDPLEKGFTKNLKNLLTVEQCAIIEKNKKMILSFVEANSERIKSLLMARKPVPGFKLVVGKNSRSYDRSEDGMAAVFSKARIPQSKTHVTKLKTGPALEKEFKNDEKIQRLLERHLKEHPGGPTVARENSTRPEWKDDMDGIEVLD